ncbi:MAG: rhomboid family intramembrane serine protease [Chitinophagaceae bacterium]|jgi:membrane associated rhomboid family serine protease
MESDIRPGRFQVLPVVIKNLIIINALVWLAQITVGRDLISIEDLFALHHFSSPYYHFWQFITYMFLHSSESFFHILFNMFALWMFGSILENLWGPARFLAFYIVCGLGAGITQALALTYDISQYNTAYELGQISVDQLYMLVNVPTLGASGAVMGIFAAFAYTFPNSQMIILPIPFPIKAKWALLGLAVLDVLGGISSESTGIAHFAHLGGAAVGIIIVLIWNRKNRNHFY